VKELPRALLLDLDDTILDDSGSGEACWDGACAAHAAAAGVAPDALRRAVDEEKALHWADPDRHRIGRLDLPAARTRIVAAALRSLGRPDDALAARLARDYGERRRAAWRLFPGAAEALDAFRSRGIRLALLTNGASDVQREKLARFDLARRFEGIFIEGEFGCGKPDPRVFRAALDAVGAAPRDAWVVGDNLEWEVAPARALGMGSVWVDARARGLPPDPPAVPDRVVRSIAELLA
jgi:putative hydrolase of the HAD superfamily